MAGVITVPKRSSNNLPTPNLGIDTHKSVATAGGYWRPFVTNARAPHPPPVKGQRAIQKKLMTLKVQPWCYITGGRALSVLYRSAILRGTQCSAPDKPMGWLAQ